MTSKDENNANYACILGILSFVICRGATLAIPNNPIGRKDVERNKRLRSCAKDLIKIEGLGLRFKGASMGIECSPGLKRLRKVGTTQRVESSSITVMDDQEDASKQGEIVELDVDEDVTLEEVAAEVTKDAKVQGEVVTTPIITAPVLKVSAPRRRRVVIIQDPEEAATASLIMRYQALKRKPVTEAQARKNMMVYLKNMAGFKMDFFKDMTYTEIRPIFEKHFNSIWSFLEKGVKDIEDEESKRKSKTLKQKAAKKQKFDEEIEELKTHLQIVPNDEDDVYTKATPLALNVPTVDY
nr:hypothetical protein [Tanacetum cinerariifolium]